ncbi:MAG: SOS response-associated peptidase [Chitinophagaceae bacterium]|nr:SOS response-associated peptidase [Chitinophagaceae bacterium]
MCYDLSFYKNVPLVAEYLNIPFAQVPAFAPTYHKVAQSFCPWPVVLYENGAYHIRLFEWGLIADYMNTPEKIKAYRSSMANARCEKMTDDKRSVWHRLRHQRCLVLTTGFFEHQDTGAKKKQPYFIRLKNQDIFCLAGLYHYAPLPDPDTGELKGTFTIITRPANELMKQIHNAGPNKHRMPLILTNELAIRWLNPGLSDEEIKNITEFEFPDAEMETWPVNTLRKPKPDDEKIIRKIEVPTLPHN